MELGDGRFVCGNAYCLRIAAVTARDAATATRGASVDDRRPRPVGADRRTRALV